jgi:hypothetical protein
MTNNSANQAVLQTDYYECKCSEDKKYRVVFDGANTGQYVVEYCQNCFDQDDKQHMISMEGLER